MSYGHIQSNYYLPKLKFNTLRAFISYLAFINPNVITTWCASLLIADTNLYTAIEQEYIARDTRKSGNLFDEQLMSNCPLTLATDSNLFTSLEHEYISRDTRGGIFNELLNNFCSLTLLPEDTSPTLPIAPADDSVNLYQITINTHCPQSLATDTNLYIAIEQEYIARDTRKSGNLYDGQLTDNCSLTLATDSNLFTSIEQEYISRDTKATLLYNEIINSSCEVTLSDA